MPPGPSTIGQALEWTQLPGLLAYPHAESAMQSRIASIRAGQAPEAVWLVEHPPLYTAGTSAQPDELVDATRFPTFKTGRGGHWTYHGPGQRTAYVMLDLHSQHGAIPPRDIRAYVAGLEDWIIRTLAKFTLTGERRAGRVGIWVCDPATGTEAKIAAIGVRITRWVTWHGIALNVSPALDHFSGIIPCGISGHGVTSLAAQGIDATMGEVDAALRATWPETFGGAPP